MEPAASRCAMEVTSAVKPTAVEPASRTMESADRSAHYAAAVESVPAVMKIVPAAIPLILHCPRIPGNRGTTGPRL